MVAISGLFQKVCWIQNTLENLLKIHKLSTFCFKNPLPSWGIKFCTNPDTQNTCWEDFDCFKTFPFRINSWKLKVVKLVYFTSKLVHYSSTPRLIACALTVNLSNESSRRPRVSQSCSSHASFLSNSLMKCGENRNCKTLPSNKWNWCITNSN